MSEHALILRKTLEFARWHETLSDVDQTRIDARLENVMLGHFGDSKSLGAGLFELRWKNGLRVYFSRRRIRGVLKTRYENAE